MVVLVVFLRIVTTAGLEERRGVRRRRRARLFSRVRQRRLQREDIFDVSDRARRRVEHAEGAVVRGDARSTERDEELDVFRRGDDGHALASGSARVVQRVRCGARRHEPVERSAEHAVLRVELILVEGIAIHELCRRVIAVCRRGRLRRETESRASESADDSVVELRERGLLTVLLRVWSRPRC